MPLTGFRDLAGFPFQPLDRFAGVAVQPCFAVDVMGQLFDPAFQGGDGFDRAGFLIFQRIALDLQALKDRGGDRLFLAELRIYFTLCLK